FRSWGPTASSTTWCGSWWGRCCGCSRASSPQRTFQGFWKPRTEKRRVPPPRPAGCTSIGSFTERPRKGERAMAKRGKHQAPEERKIIRLQDYRRGGTRPAAEAPEQEKPQPSQ